MIGDSEERALEQLWSPWRMEYILGDKHGKCVFCSAFAADPAHDRDHLVLHRGAFGAGRAATQHVWTRQVLWIRY